MKSRRYFLIQGTLATTAMVGLKPLQIIGSTLSQFTGFDGSYGKMAFLHTASMNSDDHKVIKYIQDIKNNNRNTILLSAGQDKGDGSLIYDASINGNNDLFAIDAEYKIITKGNSRVGVISAKQGEKNIIRKIEKLSTRLKKEKNCTIVVCLSQLGYKNERSPDDIKLAKASTDLDIIIGGHPANFHIHPIIALNSKNAEVIIHSAAGNSIACGKIEIDFDRQGRKNDIRFTDHISENSNPNKAISTA
jgi:2',3'-cyclic-nucleotide 2'-phosphodiesterase (5'-nucleotidase family)